ncbi:MAG: hypothetical protein JWM87_3389 [Candidatus Eremiobacteraeota bacterium]|nr:hypothetical protein [Candidatus Eremiobacteraeota bacterium]
MIHVVFERRLGRLAVFGPDGRLWHAVEASGDAGRDGPRAPYGPGFPIPPGHYRLIEQTEYEPATPEDGPGLIYVDDVDTATLQRLLGAGRARMRGASVEIARLVVAVGELARCGRSAIAIRGGGPSLAPPEDPLAPYQRLTRGDGGVRVHNADLARLMQILGPQYGTETIVFTVLGDPPRLTI